MNLTIKFKIADYILKAIQTGNKNVIETTISDLNMSYKGEEVAWAITFLQRCGLT